LLGAAGARGAGEPRCFLFLAGREEDAVVGAEAELVGEPIHVFGTVVLGDRAAPLTAFASRIAEARKTFAPGPFVHVVEEFAAEAGGVLRGHGANHAAAFDDLREQPESRTSEMAADV